MTIQCTCDKPHIRRVTCSPISIFGEVELWQAARPGGVYLVGHGMHFYHWRDALRYTLAYWTEK